MDAYKDNQNKPEYSRREFIRDLSLLLVGGAAAVVAGSCSRPLDAIDQITATYTQPAATANATATPYQPQDPTSTPEPSDTPQATETLEQKASATPEYGIRPETVTYGIISPFQAAGGALVPMPENKTISLQNADIESSIALFFDVKGNIEDYELKTNADGARYIDFMYTNQQGETQLGEALYDEDTDRFSAQFPVELGNTIVDILDETYNLVVDQTQYPQIEAEIVSHSGSTGNFWVRVGFPEGNILNGDYYATIGNLVTTNYTIEQQDDESQRILFQFANPLGGGSYVLRMFYNPDASDNDPQVDGELDVFISAPVVQPTQQPSTGGGGGGGGTDPTQQPTQDPRTKGDDQ